MLNPSETNRERLLRLIDGGPDALKEVQEERKPAAEEKKTPVITPVKPAASAKKEDRWEAVRRRLAGVRWDAASLAKAGLVLVILFFVLRSAGGLMTPSGRAEKDPSPAAQLAGIADENAGLRLVGVDWGEPPVALLEDLKTGKTYFARQDDKVKETRVKQIFKDKVLVAWRGRTLELR